MWIDKRVKFPGIEDADDRGCVLVWHEHQGVMLMHIHNMEIYGKFVTHWMPPPARPMV